MKPRLRSRSEIINEFFEAQSLVASGSYAALTAAAIERLGAAPYWEFISQAERDAAAKKGQAMPTGGYPVRNLTELDDAIHAVGRGGADHDSIRAHIIKRAKALTGTSHIPDNWNADGSLKTAAASTSGAAFAGPAPVAERPGTTGIGTTPTPTKPTDGNTATAPKGTKPTGDVENTVQCAYADETGAPCGHFASAHEDVAEGKNNGACGMKNCTCPAMLIPTQTPVGSGESTGATPGDDRAIAEASVQFAEGDVEEPAPIGAPGPAAAPAPSAGDADATGSPSGGGGVDMTTASTTPPGVAVGPAFTIPILVVEGVPTSDSRMVQENALTWRTPPLPLMCLLETSAGGGHDKAFLAGTITEITRTGTTISAKGNFHTTEEGEKASEALEQMGRMGLSADIGDVTEILGAPSPIAVDAEGPQIFAGTGTLPVTADVDETLVEGQIMGATMCPFAALPEAYIVLGDGTDVEAPIPLRAPTPEEMASVPAFHFLTSSEGCVPCIGGEVLTAAGGPLAPPRSWFEMPEPEELTPLTITPEGRVFGHLAPWNVCHTGYRGECVMAPRDHARGYSSFRTGYVLTAEGDEVAVGPLTVGTGHANDRANAVATLAHYDNTGTAAADVVPSDGKFGIWMCGALRPTTTDEQIRTLRASPPSGDWRKLNGKLALYAVLAVNSPGFVTPRALVASGVTESLVAAGRAEMAPLYEEETITAQPTRFEQLAAPIIARDLRDRMARIS